MTLSRFDNNRQPLAHRAQGVVDAVDLGSFSRVEDSSHFAFRQAELFGQRNPRRAGVAKGFKHGNFCGHQRLNLHRNHVSALRAFFSGRWVGDRFAIFQAEEDRGFQAINRLGHGVGHVRK